MLKKQTMRHQAWSAAIALLTIAGAAGAASNVAAAPIALISEGKSAHVIVLNEDPVPAEVSAAQELQQYLHRATGAFLPIRTVHDVGPDMPQIVVGPGARFDEAFPDFDAGAVGHDGIVLRTKGSNLYVSGDRPRGALYAAYTFLEEQVGCRWWTATEEYVPDRPNLAIKPMDTVYTPPVRYRELWYRNAFNGRFGAHLKLNGHHQPVPEAYGDNYEILGFVHTFYPFLPPSKYFEEHPEWYSLIDGERTADHAQLCLTNEEMRAEMVKVVLERIRENPEAGMISVSQNDWHGWCQCEDCQPLVDKEGGQSGPLIHFVNAVAKEVEKEYPDFLVETLAYQQTRQAPKHVKPRENVIVRLCSIECSFSQPLATGPQNADFKNDMEDWSAISHQLFIWDYVTNFSNYVLPHPNLHVLAPNIRFFVDNKAEGIFEQGDGGSNCGDFTELRVWLLARLLWDPSLEPDQLIDEFLAGYYGPAAEPLRAYLDLRREAIRESDYALRCFTRGTSGWLDLATLNRATALFDEAERLAGDDPVLLERVRRVRMPLDHVWLNRYHGLERLARIKGRPFEGPEDPAALCEQFIERARAFNIGQYRERGAFEEYVPQLRARFTNLEADVPALCQDLPNDAWIDIQEFEFRLNWPGEWATFVEDAKSSNGRAARMPGTHRQWATVYPLTQETAALGPMRCYAVVRCEAKASEGNAFQMGIYDSGEQRGVFHKTVTLEQAGDGAYAAYDLGVQSLSPSMYFWFAPAENPEKVEAVYIDRIFCILE